MPFDPNIPATNAEATSVMFRTQFNGLKDLIDAVPMISDGVIDEVTTLPPEQSAAAGVSVIDSVLHFSFAIPQGLTGAEGAVGPSGANGNDGLNGSDGAQGPPGEVTNGQLESAIANTSANSNGVDLLSLSPSDPPTQGEMQAVIDKMNELITALRRLG